MLTMQSVAAYSLNPVEGDIPEAAPGQALIKMNKVGICASDSQIYHGKHKYMSFPIIQGHEGVGVVQAVGSEVKNYKPGDRVILQAQFTCGVCPACRKGRENVCESRRGLGVLENGLFTEYFCAPETLLKHVPEGLADDKAVLAEPASVGIHAARLADISAGDRAVVIGAGIIGNFTAQACRRMGADVVVADIAEPKLAIARKNGLEYTVDATRENLEEAARIFFGGREVTAVFDCAGVEASLIQAVKLAASASRVVIVANFKQPISMEIPMFQRREVSLIPVMASTSKDLDESLLLLRDGAITTHDLLTRSFPLRELGAAFDYIDNNPATTMKVVVVMQESVAVAQMF